MLHHSPSECWQFSPCEHSMLMLIWLQHTHLWGSDSPSVPQEVWETVGLHTSWAACRQCWLCVKIGGWTFEPLVSVTNYNFFFRILKWFCLFSNLNQNPYDDLWHCKDACPRYSCLIINPCCGPSCPLLQFRRGVFPRPVHLSLQMEMISCTRRIGITCVWDSNHPYTHKFTWQFRSLVLEDL